MRPRTLIIGGVVFEVLGLVLFLSTFVLHALNMANDAGPRESALAFLPAPIGMGMMIIGSAMIFWGIIWAVLKRARKIVDVVETANVCRFCGSRREGLAACPACGAR